MMPSRRLCIRLIAAFALLAIAGCVRGNKTIQPVQLRVVACGSQRPIADAQVLLKYDFERDTGGFMSEGVRKRWNANAWSLGITNERGEAEVRLWALVKRGVDGKPFLVRLKDVGVPEEEVSLVMREGECVQGMSFVVTVVSVERPQEPKEEFHVRKSEGGDVVYAWSN